jgi:glycosyltransferase involved in cell wall biosynthesis
MNVAVLIPAYQPGDALAQIVAALAPHPFLAIVVVDDGSSSACSSVFAACSRQPRTTILRHGVNLGKGAALKTGLNYLLAHHPGLAGVVTADADGQHDPADILRVAQELEKQPDHLVLGARSFGAETPTRSRFGNLLTRSVVRVVMGERISDTQTGLRAIPRRLIPELLRMAACRYEFELDMLTAAKHLRIPTAEVSIRTIYAPGNPTSHFNPLRDSMRIYFVLMRFSLVSLATAAIDNLVFFLCYQASGIIFVSQVLARSAAVLFNYSTARRAVFLSGEKHIYTLPKYLALVAVNGLLSYAIIRYLADEHRWPVMPAKLLVESLLFLANFAIQRDFIFTRSRSRTLDEDQQQPALAAQPEWDTLGTPE